MPPKSALILPGLNLNPTKMAPLADFLKLQNIDSEIFQYRNSTPKNWLEDIAERLKILDGPICTVGYSLGGTLSLQLLKTLPGKIERQILFAPAIKLTPLSQNIKKLFLFPDNTPIPSFGSAKYREAPFVNLGAYKSLSKIMKELNPSNLYDVPTLVFIDPKDKLVDFSGLAEFVNANKLKNWKVVELSNSEGKFKDPYHHLIIDEEVLGQSQWSELSLEIERFLA